MAPRYKSPEIDNREIIALSNDKHYFMNWAIIIHTLDDKFRLLVCCNDWIQADKIYSSKKGAKMAFIKLFWFRAWRDDVKPEWTDSYCPEQRWLDNRLQTPRR